MISTAADFSRESAELKGLLGGRAAPMRNAAFRRQCADKSAQDAITGGRAAPSAITALDDNLNRSGSLWRTRRTQRTPGRQGRTVHKCTTSQTMCEQSAQSAMTGGRAAPSAMQELCNNPSECELLRNLQNRRATWAAGPHQY